MDTPAQGKIAVSQTRSLHVLALKFFAGILCLWVAAMVLIYALAPPPQDGRIAVLYPPSMSREETLSALTRAGAEPIENGWFHWIWAAGLGEGSDQSLKANGAWLVVKELPFIVMLGCAGGAPALPSR